MSVLVGDYILSTALLSVSYTHSELIVRYLSELGRTLSDGEILQLSNIDNTQISEEAYYEIIKKKTAVLFEMCAVIGAVSAGASNEEVAAARQFGQDLGIIFQIRDDIFDYYEETEVGKPTGNDMLEGKLTLPVIYALQSTGDEGIEYAEQQMAKRHAACMRFIDERVGDAAIKTALTAYLDYVIARKS